MRGINVLSLFNGMNTGRIALDNVGIKVDKYYSSEIKKYAIELTQHHHPDTIQLGDVANWKTWDIDLASIDLVLSGSPCQDLSQAGKRKGLSGERSGLFYTFVDILEYVKESNPNVLFLQENVGSAAKEDVLKISEALGVLPVRINSNLLTAQNRDRYYWSNIKTRKDWTDYVFTDIEQPEDKGILLKDIIESGSVDKDKSGTLLERTAEALGCYLKDEKSEKAQQQYIKRSGMGMLTCVQEETHLRQFTQIEMERLQGFPDGWTSILSYKKAGSLLGDGWTLPVIEHIFKHIK